MPPAFPALVPNRLEPANHFHAAKAVLPFSVRDFWRWAASDLASNALRGSLAEFLVAKALGVELTVRAAWDTYDLRVPLGPTIEVKSTAYLQTWGQSRLSRPCFRISPTVAWSNDMGTYAGAAERRRHADLYVFALLHHTDKATLDPTNVDHWTFLVLRSAVLDTQVGAQRTITLAALQRLLPITCRFDLLANAV